MRMWSAVTVATAFVASAAFAQMKVPQQPAATSSAPALVLSGEPSLESAKRIARDEAIKMVKENKAVWVDVRTRESFNEGHIAGAISVPETELKARIKDLPKNKYLITYCA